MKTAPTAVLAVAAPRGIPRAVEFRARQPVRLDRALCRTADVSSLLRKFKNGDSRKRV